ncbi:MAG: DUF2309 domain-containing protein [Leptospiraceae bacterium]|nr:DUF2309 domain-containing protein [Leptospiraceae bacterium]
MSIELSGKKMTDQSALNLTAALSECERMVPPTWPLQNSVAVNPFWYLRERTFDSVANRLSMVLHARLYMPVAYYLRLYTKGDIRATAIDCVLSELQETHAVVPTERGDFIRRSQAQDDSLRTYLSCAEFVDPSGYWQRTISQEVGKYAAAYFDERQALARFPWQGGTFWEGWRAAIKRDRAMHYAGARDFHNGFKELPDCQPEQAIEWMLTRMRLWHTPGAAVYLQRLMASVLGWATQFRFQEWQAGRGIPGERSAEISEILAVRLAYDYGVYLHIRNQGADVILEKWISGFESIESENLDRDDRFLYHRIWQKALEYSTQLQLSRKLASGTADSTGRDTIQMVFCIDVRSELIRRHLEQTDRRIQTIGFAGFFGVPVEYQALNSGEVEHRLPVLLPPGVRAHACHTRAHNRSASSQAANGSLNSDPDRNARQQISHRETNESFIRSFFRNLRKGALSSFLYVELFGLLSVENLVRSTMLALIRRLRGRRIPRRFDDRGSAPDHKSMRSADGQILDAPARAERAVAILKHMGIHDCAGKLVMLVGHGSATVNNAFGSALDCGACGGHAGDINARILADTLNDPEVRTQMRARGIDISDETRFVAAIHETISDEIYILDAQRVPATHADLLRSLRASIRQATHNARRERQVVVSDVLDRHVQRRTRNWAEIRPEWGLTGNNAFIVAPRARTRNINLNSRVFLHDYDWRRDENFATLELILTAPMVVTGWINLQYYASTVANEVYGAGDKLLHNLVNETGVVSGNGGDLRIGLPMQSLHDGRQFVHVPQRLSVFVEAPRGELERIIAGHDIVRQLIDNEWLYLLQIDPEDLRVHRRRPGGAYQDVE